MNNRIYYNNIQLIIIYFNKHIFYKYENYITIPKNDVIIHI